MLKFLNITKEYGDYRKALLNVSCNFEKDKIYALVGPNGSGKSTLMKIAAGLVKQTSGSVTYNDIPIGVESKKKIAYMSTEPFYYDFMKIKDIGGYYKDFFDDFDIQRYYELLEFMELSPNLKVKSLSSGMADKLKISATLARNAEVIMLDEPLNGIDILGRDQIMSSILKAKNPECTMIISSHLLDELDPIIDDVIMLKQGVLVLAGTADELRTQSGKSIVDIYREVYATGNNFIPYDRREE